MSKEPVLNKRDFLKRFLNNEFGNRTRVWETSEEWLDWWKHNETAHMKFHFRCKQPAGKTYYQKTHKGILELINNKSVNNDDYYVAEMADPKLTVIQGEVQRITGKGLHLTFNDCHKLPMRDALKKMTKMSRGIIAQQILRHYLPPGEYEHVMSLLDEYDAHVIEFSTYSKTLGTLKQNTIIWECRRY